MGNAKAEQGKALYQQGHSLAEIAQQLGVSDSTVRSWKRRGGWPESAAGATDATKHECNGATEAQREANTIVLRVAPERKKKKTGRPPLDKYDIPCMVAKIGEYIEKTKAEGKHPILKECCLENDWTYDYVMQLQREHEALSQSIKKLLAWKEVMIERGTLAGDYDRTMAIFILKQPAHGWSDKPVSKEGIELEDLTPLTEMLKDDKATDDPVEDVQPKA